MADAAARRGFKAPLAASSSAATDVTTKGRVYKDSAGAARMKETRKPAAAKTTAPSVAGTAAPSTPGQQHILQAVAASLESPATAVLAASAVPAAAGGAPRLAAPRTPAHTAALPAAAKGNRLQGNVEARWQRVEAGDKVAPASTEDAAIAAPPATRTWKKGLLGRWQKAECPAAARTSHADPTSGLGASNKRRSTKDVTAAVGKPAASEKHGKVYTAAVGKLELPPSVDNQIPLPAGEEKKDKITSAEAIKKQEKPSLECSSCHKKIQNVLLLSCHHYLCLVCAAKAAETLQHVYLTSSPRRKTRVSSYSRRRRNSLDLLQCPVCQERTALSAAASTALRQHVRFYENPPGCCFDAGPVGCTTAMATTATAVFQEEIDHSDRLDSSDVTSRRRSSSRSKEKEERIFLTLCSQCERQPAAVYCCDCVRRYCAACGVHTHDKRPQMLKHRFQLLHQQQQQAEKQGRDEEQQQEEEQQQDEEQQQQTGTERKKDVAVLDISPAQLTLHQSAQHMRTLHDCCISFRSSSQGSSSSSILAAAAGDREKMMKKKKQEKKILLKHFNEESRSTQRRFDRIRSFTEDTSETETDDEEADSIHSSAINGFHRNNGRENKESMMWDKTQSTGGAALLYRLRHVLAAVSLPEEEQEERHTRERASGGGYNISIHKHSPRYISADILRLRSITNVACYVHGTQPVEFFCCTCESYCICAYCLTGFFPSSSSNQRYPHHPMRHMHGATTREISGGGGGGDSATAGPAGTGTISSEDHTGHFLQTVDSAWYETVLPRIEDEWGRRERRKERRREEERRRGRGGGRRREDEEERKKEEYRRRRDDNNDGGEGRIYHSAKRETAALSSSSLSSSLSFSSTQKAVDDYDDRTDDEDDSSEEEETSFTIEGRGILGQALGEVDVLQRQFLLEKGKEWRQSLQNDISVVDTTFQLLLQKFHEKEQQLRGALEGFTVRFCSETEEARRRLLQQEEELQETLRKLRMHKAALDPTVVLNYYRDERTRLESICAADTPQEYRQLPLSRKSVLQHSGQVVEELCGLAADVAANIKDADGTLYERLQQEQIRRQTTHEEDIHSPTLTATSEQEENTEENVSLASSRKDIHARHSSMISRDLQITSSKAKGTQDRNKSILKAKREERELPEKLRKETEEDEEEE